ncbi:MAG: site-specific integrase [Thermoplasmatota archaeon]
MTEGASPEDSSVDAKGTVDNLTSQETYTPDAGKEGDNLPVGTRNDESEQKPQLGTDGIGDNTWTLEGDDNPLRVSEVMERFRQQTRTRLKADSQREYLQAFRRFAKDADLESYTRRQLSGPKGRTIILAHLESVPKPSWRWVVAALKPVWTYGLNLPWPIDSKRDLPKLPRVQRRQSPPDAQVKTWTKALANERDSYLRLLWLLLAQHGWRPSHVCRLKWRNVQYDDQGKPVSIVADGVRESFKTGSPVAARLAPDVVEALQRWRENAGTTSLDGPILPWRSVKGRLVSSRVQTRATFIEHWKRLERKWNLPHLSPTYLRHWVATTSRRVGLSKQATAYLMGHDPTQGGAMVDWYDAPQLQDVFDEQAAKLPYGPLGFLEPPTVELEGGLSKEVVSLVSAYLAGQTGTMEFATTMEKVRSQRPTPQTPALET